MIFEEKSFSCYILLTNQISLSSCLYIVGNWAVFVHLVFFYKQPVYKQVALKWQIAKQLSGLKPFSLSNNKTFRLKKSGVFPL